MKKLKTPALCLLSFCFLSNANAAFSINNFFNRNNGNQERPSTQRGQEEGGEARRAKLEELLAEQGVTIPEDWEEMTKTERDEFLETSGVEVSKKEIRNKKKSARKAKNYKKFNQKLLSKKEFKDANKIKNKAAVQFLQQRGIINGYEDGSFGPANPINRAESLKVLLEVLGEGPEEDTHTEFSDISDNAWYSGYVKKAVLRGIVSGYEDGTFRPEKTINQVELLKLAFESFGIDLSDYEVTDLPEEAERNAWYAQYLQYALDNDLLDEEDVDLGEGMTREMFSEVIYRLIQQLEGVE
jgi:hypothetical protein